MTARFGLRMRQVWPPGRCARRLSGRTLHDDGGETCTQSKSTTSQEVRRPSGPEGGQLHRCSRGDIRDPRDRTVPARRPRSSRSSVCAVPTGAPIRILGLDPQKDRDQVRKRVGVQLQEARLPDRLKVWEALDLYSSFYETPVSWRDLADRLGLDDKLDTRFSELSGGQRQRLSIALALVGDPEVAVLDELTTGLDPAARRETWDLIEDVRSRGVTVLLVTHSMEEAEHLSDRLALIDQGRVVAVDTPSGLISRAAPAVRIRFVPSSPLERFGSRCHAGGRGCDRERRSTGRSPARATCSTPSCPSSPDARSSQSSSGWIRPPSTTPSLLSPVARPRTDQGRILCKPLPS